MDKISVIIPVYNVENYLEECIESVINQSYSDIEIILVNDGSIDNSNEICLKYAKMYRNILHVTKENKGLSDARNVGLSIASGKYIMFVDSDDVLFKNSCKELYDEIEKRQADYVIGNYINMDEDGTIWDNPVFDIQKYSNFKLSINDYGDSFYVMNSSVCNKIFKKEFIDKNNFKFEVGLPAEDAIFTTLCYIKANNVWYVNKIIYKYRQRKETSISTNCNYKYFKGISMAYKKIYTNFDENSQLGFYRFFYAKSMTYMLYKFIDSKKLSDEERIEILSEMRWFYKLSIELDVPACQKSLSILIYKIIQGQYREVIDICKVISDIREYMPKETKTNMSKPTDKMYEELLKYNYEGKSVYE